MKEDFAETQLKKYGWSRGQGLGKNSEGIKEPINLGDNSKDWSFEWWDHVYNKTLNNIKVSTTLDGEVNVTKVSKEAIIPKNRVGTISTEESMYSLTLSPTFLNVSTEDDKSISSSTSVARRPFLYDNFVKSLTGSLDMNKINKKSTKREISNRNCDPDEGNGHQIEDLQDIVDVKPNTDRKNKKSKID
ncbi:15396_t:CDS:2 [Cetraspora pellucida]|uniref:15396_t:CDS:1 n=1 Tax=Cetraspora pellucida TaxID=1433469 RepID=A0ACA9K3R5_9GLOM|nr:15396_t:CDS:2 [Cetraspora pellucida]